MKQDLKQDENLKRYLLKDLSDENQINLIEQRLLFDNDFLEEIELAEDELIDEYLSGVLSQLEQSQFEKHFLCSTERQHKFKFARALKKYVQETAPPVKVPPLKKGLSISASLSQVLGWQNPLAVAATAIALLIVIGGGLAIWRVFSQPSRTDQGLAILRQLYQGQRPIEARLSANFDYAPLSKTRGANNRGQSIENKIARDKAASLFFEASENPATAADAHHALGLYYLADKQTEAALKEFETALQTAPNNASLESDTGAAFLEQAGQEQVEEKGKSSIESRAHALEHLNKALSLNSTLPAALFNKAICLQQMMLFGQAREAWAEYLKLDPASGWADEARRNLAELDERQESSKSPPVVLREFLAAAKKNDKEKAWEILSQTRELVTQTTIPLQLARETIKVEPIGRREEILRAFIFAGKLDEEHHRDPFVSELALYYAKLNDSQRHLLAEAEGQTSSGYELLLKANFALALQCFSAAQEKYQKAGNIWEAGLAEYQICYCLTRLDKLNDSNRKLEALSNFSHRHEFKWLASLAFGWMANNYELLGDCSKSLNFGLRARSLAIEVSDAYNLQRILNQIADQYKQIGNNQKSIQYIDQGLRVSNSYYLAPRQKWRNLTFATETFYNLKLFEAAAAFGREELSCAEDILQDKWLQHTSLLHLGKVYVALKRPAEAMQSINAGLELADYLQDQTMKQRVTAESLLALANAQREFGDCSSALGNYEQTLAVFQKMEFELYTYAARKGRFLCYAAEQDDIAVRTEIPNILQLFEHNRTKILEERNRNSFFDEEQDIYDLAAQYSYQKLGQAESSFDYLETSRARSLLDAIDHGAEVTPAGGDFDLNFPQVAQPLSLSEIRKRLPQNTQLIQYAVFKDKILIFLITGGDFVVREKSVDSATLEEQVVRYERLLNEPIRRAGRNADFFALSRNLYELLITPVEAELSPSKTICVVPDKMLSQVSFAALVSPHTGEYLITAYPLVSAPSASIFVLLSEAAASINKSAGEETLLSIGNPDFSKRQYPELSDLTSAAQEAKMISEFYSKSVLLIGADAAKERVETDFGNANIIHYAGHYAVNENSPLLSKFLLAARPDAASTTAGELALYEIFTRKLPRAKLIVLSACETGVEGYRKSEGMTGAARAFLAAGVPLVIASRWAVDSEATANLMIKFHQYRKQRGFSSIEALRHAQLALLLDADSKYSDPYFWAAFSPIGGYADY